MKPYGSSLSSHQLGGSFLKLNILTSLTLVASMNSSDMFRIDSWYPFGSLESITLANIYLGFNRTDFHLLRGHGDMARQPKKKKEKKKKRKLLNLSSCANLRH